MSGKRDAVHSYTTVPGAVFPSVVPRAAIASVPYGGLTWFLAAQALGLDRKSDAVTVGVGTAVVVFLAILAFAYIGNSRRQYTLTEDGIVETKWAFWTREQTLPYEDIEDLTFTQSRVQSLYGVGTIRINHVETTEKGDEEEMRIRYVETPEAVFSAIRSELVDSDAGAHVDVETSMQGGSKGASSLASEGLAAETSSAYLMPIAVVNPRLSSAAFVGGLVGGVFSLFILAGIVLTGGLTAIPDIGELEQVEAFSGIAEMLLVVFPPTFMALKKVRTSDRRQYELYQDHVRVLDGRETTTIQYEDIGEIRSWGLPWGFGYVAITDDFGNALARLVYVPDPEGFEETLRELMSAHQ